MEEELYEELPDPGVLQEEDLYVDTESFTPALPPQMDELYEDCNSPPPPPLPPAIRPPPPPPLPSINTNQRRGSELPPKKKKQSQPPLQTQGLNMNEILEKRKKLQKVSSRTSDSMQSSVDSHTTNETPPWQVKAMLRKSVDYSEQSKKDEKPEWMIKPLKRIGDRPASVTESQAGIADKSGSLPFPVRLKKTGISLEQEEPDSEITPRLSVLSCKDVSVTGPTLKKVPKPSPKPRPSNPATQGDGSGGTTPTQSPRSSFVPLISKKPSSLHNGDVSGSPPDLRSLPKPQQDASFPEVNHFPQSPRIPNRGKPVDFASSKPAEVPHPPQDSSLSRPPLLQPPHSVESEVPPPDVSLLPKPALSPPDVRSLPKPGQALPALAPRLSREGLSVSNSSSHALPNRSLVSDVALKTQGETSSDVNTNVPRYRRRALPVVDINNPPPKPHHSKPPSLPSLGAQLLRPRSDTELESEVNSLLADIDHKSDRLKVSDGYPADDIYDDVEPDNEQKPSPVKYSLGGVTTTSSSDAYPADDIYDDVAADHDLPPEPPPPVEDELYDDIHPEEKGSKLSESMESVASFASDSDAGESADNDLEGSMPVDGGDTLKLNRKEMNKLKKQEKEREKQLEKERRIQKKKEEEERKLNEKMETQRKKNFEKTRKAFKLKGDEETKLVVYTNQAICKAKKNFLTFNEGEQVKVLFMSAYQAPNKKEFPQGAWLVVKSDGMVGYVDKLHLDTSHIGGLEVFDHGYGQDAEDLYEDIAANTTPQQRQTSPLQKQSLPPPSTPAPPPPGSPPPPPPPDMEDLECYDDVSVGGHLVEEDLYEELDA